MNLATAISVGGSPGLGNQTTRLGNPPKKALCYDDLIGE